MRKVFRINFRFIISVFVCFAVAFGFSSIFKTYAVAPPDLNRLGFYDEASWCPNFLDPPYSLNETEANSLSTLCGTVVNSDGNGPIEGLTVMQFFGDPVSPTLKYKGRLTGLYNSTGTDAYGRFHLTTTKVGPGGATVYLAFYCNDDQVSLQRVRSTFDNYQIGTSC